MAINIIIGFVLGFAVAAYMFNDKIKDKVNSMIKNKKDGVVCSCGQKIKTESYCPNCGRKIGE
jgi:hypothetical protein